MSNCDHCNREIHNEDIGRVEILVRSPLSTLGVEHVVCGMCSFNLGEWLCPALKDDYTWNSELMAAREKLRALYGD